MIAFRCNALENGVYYIANSYGFSLVACWRAKSGPDCIGQMI